MAHTAAVDVVVSGEVQGVSFRAYAAQEAVRLEVSGWIRNEPGGEVRTHVEGDVDAVDAMVAWLHAGSPGADVAEVSVSESTVEGLSSFEVRY